MDNIVVIGSLNMDFAIEVNKMPKTGETILGKRVALIPGGKGANQAYAVGRLGKKVRMVGAVGNDIFGQKLIHNLKKAGVETDGIMVSETADSGQAFISIDENGDNSIIVIQGANQEVGKEWIDQNEACIEGCDAVVMQLEIPVSTVTYAAALAHNKGKLVLLDPAPARADLPEELLQAVDIIKPNETELATITGMPVSTKEDIVKAAESLLKRGVGKVIVTRGEEGALLVGEDGVREFSAEKVETVDTTAAGDSFTAGVITALEDGNYDEALEFAARVSAITVTRKGAQTSIPTLEEVTECRKGRD